MFKIPSFAVENFIKSEFKYKLTSDKKEIQICSIYTQDVKFKCYINVEQFVFCDFKAGVSGSCYTLFKDYLNVVSQKEVMLYIMRKYADGQFFILDEQKKEIHFDDDNSIIRNFNTNERPIYFYQKDKIGNFGKACLKYLMQRKISVDYIRSMGYVYNKFSKFHQRIILPYFEDGKMVYFQARSQDKNNQLRYLNPIGLNKQNYIFNYDYLNDDELILVEGVFDAMSIDRNEQTATCIGGAFLSTKQLIKIFSKAKPKRIIYVPDQDETGQKEIDKNVKNIYLCADYTPEILIYNVPKPFKDFNELLVNTGKNYILKKECEQYSKLRFSF